MSGKENETADDKRGQHKHSFPSPLFDFQSESAAIVKRVFIMLDGVINAASVNERTSRGSS